MATGAAPTEQAVPLGGLVAKRLANTKKEKERPLPNSEVVTWQQKKGKATFVKEQKDTDPGKGVGSNKRNEEYLERILILILAVKGYQARIFILAFMVEGFWMLFGENFVVVAFGTAALPSYIWASYIVFPIGLALLAFAAYYLFTRYTLEDSQERKGNAIVLALQVSFGVIFWMLGLYVATALGLGAFSLPALAMIIIGAFNGLGIVIGISMFNGFRISIGNFFGKSILKSWMGAEINSKYTLKEWIVLWFCGSLTGAAFQYIASLTTFAGITGISLSFVQFAFIAFPVLGIGLLVDKFLKSRRIIKEPVEIELTHVKAPLKAPPKHCQFFGRRPPRHHREQSLQMIVPAPNRLANCSAILPILPAPCVNSTSLG